MSAKEYLRQLITLDAYIRARKEDYEMVLSMATQATQRLKDVQVLTSRRPGKQEDLMVKCVEVSIEIDKKTLLLLELQNEARGLIEGLKDDRYRTILTLRYLLGRSWGYIAEHMGYSIRQVHRLHGEALLAFSRNMA